MELIKLYEIRDTIIERMNETNDKKELACLAIQLDEIQDEIDEANDWM